MSGEQRVTKARTKPDETIILTTLREMSQWFDHVMPGPHSCQ